MVNYSQEQMGYQDHQYDNFSVGSNVTTLRRSDMAKRSNRPNPFLNATNTNTKNMNSESKYDNKLSSWQQQFQKPAHNPFRRNRSFGSLPEMKKKSFVQTSAGFRPRHKSVEKSNNNETLFYKTAMARLTRDDIKNATGVGLDDHQLNAVKNRFQPKTGGFAAIIEEEPSEDGLRDAVFGGVCLKPGQWGNFGDKSSSSMRRSRSGVTLR